MSAITARQLAEQIPAAANDSHISSTDGARKVYCNPDMPPNWLARPWTIINDFGWIVGRPRRSMAHPRAANGIWRRSTAPFARMMAAKAQPVGMP